MLLNERLEPRDDLIHGDRQWNVFVLPTPQYFLNTHCNADPFNGMLGQLPFKTVL